MSGINTITEKDNTDKTLSPTKALLPTDNRTVISAHGKDSSLASDLDELEKTSPIVVAVIKYDEGTNRIKRK